MKSKHVTFYAVTVALLIPGVTYGGFGSVVASFPCPGIGPLGIARSNQYLFVLAGVEQGPKRGLRLIYRVNPETGSVKNAFAPPDGGSENYGGLAFTVPAHVWITNNDRDTVYKLSAVNGSVIDSWLCYPGIQNGIAAEHNQAQGGPVKGIWVSSVGSPAVFRKFTPQGEHLEDWLWSMWTSDMGWDYDVSQFWAGSFNAPYFVYRFTPQGSISASFPSPAVSWPVWATEYYEGYLWLATDRTEMEVKSYIWKVDVTEVGVNPASLGRVKVLFR